MKFYNPDRKVHLTISKDFIESLFEIARMHYPKEFGGFLLGRYGHDLTSLIVDKSIEPKSYDNSTSLFTRTSKGIENLFALEEERYYVGEWHTHPDSSSMFSVTDLKAMQNIISKNQLRIKNPILLILGINENSILDFSIYIFHNNNLCRYEQN